MGGQEHCIRTTDEHNQPSYATVRGASVMYAHRYSTCSLISKFFGSVPVIGSVPVVSAEEIRSGATCSTFRGKS